MPFTPFHLGAGLLCKSLAPKTQSLLLFSGIQIAIDVEPAVRMAMGQGDLHGFSHTLTGISLISAACALLWRRMEKTTWGQVRLPYLDMRSLIDTAFFAGISHLILDIFTHANVYPGIQLHFGMEVAEFLAFGMGVVGVLILAARLVVIEVSGFLLGHMRRLWSRLPFNDRFGGGGS